MVILFTKGDCTQGNKKKEQRRGIGAFANGRGRELQRSFILQGSKEDGDSDHRNPKNDYGKPRSPRVAISEAPE
jgi:hypothetical protein